MQHELGSMVWADLDSPVLVVPIGSCEQHGPHLPLDTDTRIAIALAGRLAAQRDRLVVTPPVAITASGEHSGFPGTLSIGTEATELLLVELVRSADWSSGVVFVNGHGGNAEAVMRATARLASEGRNTLAWWPRVAGGDLHAGHTETSLMLALHPELVRFERAVAGPVASVDELRRGGVASVSPTGVLGDPTDANAADGDRIAAALLTDLLAAFDNWARPGAT